MVDKAWRFLERVVDGDVVQDAPLIRERISAANKMIEQYAGKPAPKTDDKESGGFTLVMPPFYAEWWEAQENGRATNGDERSGERSPG